MKLTYITNARIPTEKAHGIQIMKMCEAFANQGLEVELVVPHRYNKIKEDPFSYYDVERNFKLTKLPTIDLMPVAGPFKWLAYLVNYIIFSTLSFFYCLFKDSDVFYGRHELPLLYLSFWKENVFWEVHQPRNTFITKLLLKVVDGVISISGGLKDFLVSVGYPEEKILVAHDAVDIEQFDINLSKKEARKKLDLSQDKKIVMYTGHLYPEKGVDTLAKAAKKLSEDCRVVFVGGTDEYIKRFQEKYGEVSAIKIVGQKPHEEIPCWLKAADVLVIPNSGKDETSAKYTSPMKLFEYIASDRPIVASDLPALREILQAGEAAFFKPDSVDSLVEVVTSNNLPGISASKENSDRFSWKQRVTKIRSFLEANI